MNVVNATSVNPPPIPSSSPSPPIESQKNTEFLIELLSENGICPTRAHDEDAGWDLYSAVNTVVPMRGKMIVKTDIAVAMPWGTYGRIAPRSGLAAKHAIDVLAGVVDYGYINAVGVVLVNHSDIDFHIVKGDRIAQLVLEKIDTDSKPTVVSKLPNTDRGMGGFGSSGK